MDQVQKFLTKFFRGVGTARARRLERAVALGEWGRIQSELVGDPSTYQNAGAYKKAVLCTDIVRKLLLPGDAEKRSQAAIETFYSCEAECASTNTRLHRFHPNREFLRDSKDVRVAQFITAWRKECARVLGRCPGNWTLTPLFSGGSTLSDKGKLITIPDKMSSDQTLYERTGDVAFDALYGTILSKRRRTIVRGNRFFTVPKDSQKDRGCCVEASINVSLQLAVGRVLKRRIREAYGVDLRQAQSLHRRLARDASAGLRDLATIDLSNASDTVAKGLIELLLPADWLRLLNSLRASHTLIEGKWVLLEKFSSMGNGFTFELETLLFHTLCVALGAPEVHVYGDDIIVSGSHALDVVSALRYFGFTPNKKKTFLSGPFRESCGGDFWGGEAVRPHYLKELPDEPQKWLALANGLRRVDPELTMFSAAWWFCIDQLPLEWRSYGPSELGDTCLHVPDPFRFSVMHRFKHRCGGHTETTWLPAYKIMVPVSRKYHLAKYWSADVAMAAAALGVPPEVSTRDDVIGYRRAFVAAWGVNNTQAGFEDGEDPIKDGENSIAIR